MQTKINNTVKCMLAAGATAAIAIGLGGAANAAPSGPATASEALNSLQAQGFHVILDKIGTAPLDQCVVHSVRSGQTFERNDSGAPGAGSSIVTTVTDKTVYLDVDC
jgi:hypothetical protein